MNAILTPESSSRRLARTATSQHFIGASTAFGRIIAVEPRLYNAEATVEHRDGSTSVYPLHFLQAHGVQGARG